MTVLQHCHRHVLQAAGHLAKRALIALLWSGRSPTAQGRTSDHHKANKKALLGWHALGVAWCLFWMKLDCPKNMSKKQQEFMKVQTSFWMRFARASNDFVDWLPNHQSRGTSSKRLRGHWGHLTEGSTGGKHRLQDQTWSAAGYAFAYRRLRGTTADLSTGRGFAVQFRNSNIVLWVKNQLKKKGSPNKDQFGHLWMFARTTRILTHSQIRELIWFVMAGILTIYDSHPWTFGWSHTASEMDIPGWSTTWMWAYYNDNKWLSAWVETWLAPLGPTKQTSISKAMRWGNGTHIAFFTVVHHDWS